MSDPVLGSHEYLKSEVCAFFKLLGDRPFWEREDQPEAACFALAYVYLHTEEPDESCLRAFRFALDECARRHFLAIRMGVQSC